MPARARAASPPPVDRWATLALWVLAVSPLALIPSGEFRFELPKLLVAVIGVGLAGWAVRAGRLPRAVTGWLRWAGCFSWWRLSLLPRRWRSCSAGGLGTRARSGF